MKILLVDDDYDFRQYFKAVGDEIGWHIVAVASGKKALEVCEETVFDIIFMDLVMEHMDGIETTRQLQKALLHLKSVPVIAVTGNYSRDNYISTIESGMVDILRKPFTINELREICDKFCKRGRSACYEESFNRFKEKFNGNITKAHTIMNMTRETSVKDLEHIEYAAEKNDVDVCRLLMHRLKGRFLTVYMENYADIVSNLHSIIRENGITEEFKSGIKSLIKDLKV